ncbi:MULTISPECIES: N-acetylmuramic acid 6-phosphate etherase [Bacillaceae]|jgi:N-acetylmuramic acid 6-phosphate etherase|uniref:N-acetylmuramic acid 6-phosphate etherase n=1 Tax=Bacillaceae TaxID=186817 RepID=UPI001C121DF3|nr:MULTISPECIES: N-acetylmuramic acid 6-phosphate etherase [Bacillaceae]MBU5343359.1 N-acetylmuramic acid 6-phosphate etherase [Caldifermentibacillus hisashii]
MDTNLTLLTEMRNEQSENLHEFSTFEIIQLMNEEDKKVAFVVEKALPQISIAVSKMVEVIENGGKIVYFGAGTSGRLGVLDASECPPTFGVSPELFKGIIAGGDEALRNAIENAEDNVEAGKQDVQLHVTEKDLVVGIASSGYTPYVLGAVEFAKERGIPTIGISCNESTKLSSLVDIAIELPVGPEVVTGSTRLKAGTAQKMVLNMLSTATMIRTGKVYKNLMINVQATNQKLKNRSIRIIQEITGTDEQTAKKTSERAKGDTRVAILMLLFQVDYITAKQTIDKHNDNFVKAFNELKEKTVKINFD